MSVAIIGHTRGIGAELMRQYYDHYPRGFSRSTGTDIARREDREKIVQACADCDTVFVVAFSDEVKDAQHEMLVDLWNAYEYEEKRLVVISSDSPDSWKGRMRKYPTYKKMIDHSAMQMSRLARPCSVINIKPGWVNTERSQKSKNSGLCISTESLALSIRRIVELPQDIRPASVTLLPDPKYGITHD